MFSKEVMPNLLLFCVWRGKALAEHEVMVILAEICGSTGIQGVEESFDGSFRREARNLCVNIIIVLIYRKDPSLRVGVTHWILGLP